LDQGRYVPIGQKSSFEIYCNCQFGIIAQEEAKQREVADLNRQAERDHLVEQARIEKATCKKCGDTGWYRWECRGEYFSCECDQCDIIIKKKMERWDGLPLGWGEMHRRCGFTNYQVNAKLLGAKHRQKALDTVKAWTDWHTDGSDTENAPHDWVILLGGYGTGKTHLAAAATRNLLRGRQETVFAEVPALLEWIRSGYRRKGKTYYSDDENPDQLFERLMDVPFLVLDDLGAQRDTDWVNEKLYRLINHRYVNELPMLVTSNKPLAEMDGRIASRLSDKRLSDVLDCGQLDYRQVGGR
jgi:DNA replication protein DnaC